MTFYGRNGRDVFCGDEPIWSSPPLALDLEDLKKFSAWEIAEHGGRIAELILRICVKRKASACTVQRFAIEVLQQLKANWEFDAVYVRDWEYRMRCGERYAVLFKQ